MGRGVLDGEAEVSSWKNQESKEKNGELEVQLKLLGCRASLVPITPVARLEFVRPSLELGFVRLVYLGIWVAIEKDVFTKRNKCPKGERSKKKRTKESVYIV